MKIVNKQKVDNFLGNYLLEDTIFVFDFDWTITLKSGEGSSFAPISNSKTKAWDYMSFIDSYYIKIEKSSNFEDLEDHLMDHDKLLAKSWLCFKDFQDIMMQQWWDLTMLVWIKFNIDVDNYDVSKVEFRLWVRAFLEFLLKNNLEFLVVSAWVKNYIDNFFRVNNFDTQRMHIIANEFITDNQGRAISYDKNLITAFTKQHLNYTSYNLDKKTYAFQFGDSLWDAHIVNDYFEETNLIKIWFTNGDLWKEEVFLKHFDIVFTGKDEWIEEFIKLLNI